MHLCRDGEPPASLPRCAFKIQTHQWTLGDSEIDEIFRIFRYRFLFSLRLIWLYSTLGTPDEKTWPGVSELPDFKSTFPKWKPQDLREHASKLNDMGINLLEVLLEHRYIVLTLQQLLAYNPAARISAKKALCHPFFNDALGDQ
jgi:hypothetical protein